MRSTIFARLQHQPGRARSWYMFVELIEDNNGRTQNWLTGNMKSSTGYGGYSNLAIEIEQGLGNPKWQKAMLTCWAFTRAGE